MYADGIPTVVLNDDSGRASAIMRLVNNSGNPVLVLKENGQDKVIIDENSLLDKKTNDPLVKVEEQNKVIPIAVALASGFAGGIFSIFIARPRKIVAVSEVRV